MKLLLRLRAAITRARRPLFLPRPELQRPGFGGVVLVPSAGYHVAELWPLATELRARGHRVTFMTPRVSPDSVADALRCAAPAERLYAWPRWFGGLPAFRAVVVMNDWGPTRRLVELARERGVPSFGKVEGAQDFRDCDTGRARRPYRTVDHVLAQGTNDARELGDAEAVTVVGSTRLERLRARPERSDWSFSDPVVVINSNFTFGVLESQRLQWLDAVLTACQGVARPIVCQHGADERLPQRYPVAATSVHELLLESADVLVSRFSTVPFEAMALGVPFVYYPPRAETVPTFHNPDGAFEVAWSTDSLSDAIREALKWRGKYRERSQSFFSAQVSVTSTASEARAAAAVDSKVAPEEGPRSEDGEFYFRAPRPPH